MAARTTGKPSERSFADYGRGNQVGGISRACGDRCTAAGFTKRGVVIEHTPGSFVVKVGIDLVSLDAPRRNVTERSLRSLPTRDPSLNSEPTLSLLRRHGSLTRVLGVRNQKFVV
jgi:hypothetical protein